VDAASNRSSICVQNEEGNTLHPFSKESIELARGVQKYVLIHTFAKMKADL